MGDAAAVSDSAIDAAIRHRGSAQADSLGLQLHHLTATTPLVYTRYDPSFSFVLRGRKRVLIGDDDEEWGAGSFLITPIDLPVVAQVVEVDESGDFVSGNWRLDPIVIADVLARLPPRDALLPPTRLGTVTPELAGVLDRLLRVLDAPDDLEVLRRPLAHELILRLLQSDQGARVLAAGGSGRSALVTAAVGLVVADPGAPWTVDSLAAAVSTSAATLNRRFRELTGMSPMVYLKQIRLGEARRRMLTGGEAVAHAAAAVGYANASHFARDYRRAYGAAPAQDIASFGGSLRVVPWD